MAALTWVWIEGDFGRGDALTGGEGALEGLRRRLRRRGTGGCAAPWQRSLRG